MIDDSLGDRSPEFGHAFSEPLRHAATVKRQICGSRAFHCEILGYLVKRRNQSI